MVPFTCPLCATDTSLGQDIPMLPLDPIYRCD